jgi:hypothetical protein
MKTRFYTEDGPKIFHRSLWQKLITLWGWLGPKYTHGPLESEIRQLDVVELLAESCIAEATAPEPDASPAA